MTGWAPRRFWKATTVAPRDGGFAVLLDDRPLHTPARRPALLPARALAEAVAAEWDAQEGTLAPATMPLTRLVNAALDTVSEHRAQVIAATAAFGETDLTCYRAALTALEVAREDAARQSRYLATYVKPTLAQNAEYPKRWILAGLAGLFLLLIWSILALIYYSIRDRS